MNSEKPDRVISTTRQSFSHGRTRLVHVETIISSQPDLNRKIGRRIKRTGTKVVLSTASAKAATGAKLDKVKMKKTKKKKLLRLKFRPKRLRLIGYTTGVKGLKKSASRGSFGSGRGTSVGLSAGMPGNEDIDPPALSSRSTPEDRWREQNKFKR